MKIDQDFLSILTEAGVTPAAIEQLRKAALCLPDLTAVIDPTSQEFHEAQEAIFSLLGVMGVPTETSFDHLNAELQATAGDEDDASEEWQKSLWQDRDWKNS